MSVDQWASMMGCSVRTAFRRAAKGEVQRMEAPDGSVRLRLPDGAVVPVTASVGAGGLPELVQRVMTLKQEAEAQREAAWQAARLADQRAAKAGRRTLVAAAVAAMCVMTAGGWYLTASGDMSARLQEAAASRAAMEAHASVLAAALRQSQQEAATAREQMAAIEQGAGLLLLAPEPMAAAMPVMTLGQAR